MNVTCQNETDALSRAVLEINVAYHPGVMSQVVGLISRRTFTIEGILCMPIRDGLESRIWLLVNEHQRLPQMIRQLEKLEDVSAVHRHAAGHAVFAQLGKLF